MSLHSLNHVNGRSLVLWRIDDTVADLLAMVTISDELKTNILSLPRENRQKEKLIALYLVQKLSGVDTQIHYRSNGAPYLYQSNLNISITHTKGWLAIQASSIYDVGVDVEYKSDRIVKIAHKFISEVESSFIEETKKVDYMNLIWCAKEALYKIAQIDGAVFTETFLIEPFILSTKGSIVGKVISENGTISHRFGYKMNDNYYLVYKE